MMTTIEHHIELRDGANKALTWPELFSTSLPLQTYEKISIQIFG
jgi:hypothetical protein